MLSLLKGELSSIGESGEQSPDTDSDIVNGKVVVDYRPLGLVLR